MGFLQNAIFNEELAYATPFRRIKWMPALILVSNKWSSMSENTDLHTPRYGTTESIINKQMWACLHIPRYGDTTTSKSITGSFELINFLIPSFPNHKIHIDEITNRYPTLMKYFLILYDTLYLDFKRSMFNLDFMW